MSTQEDYYRTRYAVWELTLKCNLACQHCGSRAGQPRTQELTTAEALDLVQQLAQIGIREVTLIGGEAFLRPDWLEIAAAIARAGMICNLTTGGYGLSLQLAQAMQRAGIAAVSVSIDGLETTHDRLRGKQGAWHSAFRTMQHLRQVGVPFACNTQINRLSAPELPRIYEQIRDAGVYAWQIQLTVPMGHAADHWEILLQPCELLDLFPLLAQIAQWAAQEGVRLYPGNNVGYYGPYESLLRGGGHPGAVWQGCGAGLNTLGIEADGTIKACPSLPTSAYAGGNIRDQPLASMMAQSEALRFNFNAGLPEGTAHLWGFCQTCEFAALCRGGCNWTAHVFFGRRGNNPYCHHRALNLARQGLRERLALNIPAPGLPFDHGQFLLFQEPLNAPWPEPDPLYFTADQVQWSSSWTEQPVKVC
uniref:Radical SAM domain protein n=1 Tax=Cyanothece sp. (strain PCC 7425 / ATCC 29141) TaxID=395961 RepID=B8HM33_CYAP4